MFQELKETTLDVWSYLIKAFEYVSPIFVGVSTVVSYLIFPSESYIAPVVVILIALILDIASKYYSVSVQCGGFKKAIKMGKLRSETLWRGTKKKLVSVLVILILCGLSYRISTATEIAIFISTVVYTFLFLREAQSVIENLIDAGHEDLGWLLMLIKKKKNDILDSNDIDNSEDQQEKK